MRRSLRVGVAALLVGPILAACRDPSPPSPAAPPAWDREVARREVLAAALDVMGEMRDGDETPGEVLVVDDTLRPRHGSCYDFDEERLPPGRSADVMNLPDGRKALRPQIEGLVTETFDDWVAHTAPAPAPRAVTGKRSIEWITEADWDALTWRAFRKRFPKSTWKIELSDVGFSPAHDQALLYGIHQMEGTGSGFWVLLQRQDDRWAVVQRKRTFIACGPCWPDPNITPSDDDLRKGR